MATIPADRRGFTLVELLLALAVSALVALLAYGGLSTAAGAAQRHEAQVRRLADIQLALDILEKDLRQLAHRPIRDEAGNFQPALEGGAGAPALLRFTRRGWANPLGQPRSELQRVRYLARDGGLWREHWLAPDRPPGTQGPRAVLLLEGLEAAEVEFLAEEDAAPLLSGLPESGWRLYWHSLESRRGPEAGERFPLALRLRLVLADFGEVNRVIEIL